MLKTSKYTDLYLMTTLYLCTIYMYFRFIVIVLPMKSRSWCTSGNTQRILASVWIVSLLLSSPAFYVVVKFFVTDFFKFRALVQINYIWCCDQIETWSLIITFSWWWTLLSFNPSSNISFVLYNNKKKRIKQNLYHLLYNQTSFGNLGYDRSAVLLSCRRRRDRKKPRSRFTASVARKRTLVDERSSALCLGLTSVAIQ